MARIEGRGTLKAEVVLVLSEHEAAALDALFGYDVEEFLKAFYEKMGRAYLQPYEDGLRSLHKQRTVLQAVLDRFRNAREAFDEGRFDR